MTKKDYKAIARTLSTVYDLSNTQDELDNLELIINQLILTFKKDNPRFNTFKFVYAINPEIPEVLDIVLDIV